MSGYLLDTNCISELVRAKPEPRVMQWIFAGRIVPIDAAIADRWGSIAAHAKRTGNPLAVIDGLITATALHYNLTVVSRNARDFPLAQVLNPWKA